MSKKPFVNPSIKLKATIKELRKKVKYWKHQCEKMFIKEELRKNRDWQNIK
jgi:hypothetical protein